MFKEQLIEAASKIGSEIDNLYSYTHVLEAQLDKEKNKTKAFAEILREAIKKLEEE